MIVGLGIDLVEIGRIKRVLERFGPRFVKMVLHESELAGFLAPGPRETLCAHTVARIAARFAAKEAGAKALGTGFAGGIRFPDIRILSLASGKPEISFHGNALKRMRELGATRAHLSLTHARSTAGAVVVLEGAQAETSVP